MRNKALTSSDPAFDEMLGRYFDGELSPGEALEVEACLQEDLDAAEKLEKLAQTQAMLRETYSSELSQVNFGDFWQGIEKGIEAQQVGPGRVRGSASLLEPFKRFFDWLGASGWQGAAAGLGAAALLAVVFSVAQFGGFLGPEAHDADGPVASGDDPTTPDEDSREENLFASRGEVIVDGVEITSLSGGENATVMVLNAPDQATIIWIQEDDEEEGTSI